MEIDEEIKANTRLRLSNHPLWARRANNWEVEVLSVVQLRGLEATSFSHTFSVTRYQTQQT